MSFLQLVLRAPWRIVFLIIDELYQLENCKVGSTSHDENNPLAAETKCCGRREHCGQSYS